MNEEFKNLIVQMCKELHSSLSYDAIVIASSNLMVAKAIEKQTEVSAEILKNQKALLNIHKNK